MKVRCTHIDWDITDEYLKEIFGSTVNKDGLPYTAKDLKLPTYDEEVEIEIDDEEWDAAVEDGEESYLVTNKLSDEYNWLINSLVILEDGDAAKHD